MFSFFIAFLLIIPINCNITSASYCSKIVQNPPPMKRYVTCNSITKSVHLYWGSDPARAAAAFFKSILHYGLGYQNVELHKGLHNLQEFAASVSHNAGREYERVILALSTGWEPSLPPKYGSYGDQCGLAGPRLEELGMSQIPARQQLFLYLAANFRHEEVCTKTIEWKLYTNITVMSECGFINNNKSYNVEDKLTVYWLDSNNVTIKNKLKERVDTLQLLEFKEISRSYLFQLLENSIDSFFFLDYNIWSNYPNVQIVQLPPCLPNGNDTCQQELDTAISMRVADVLDLDIYAHQLLQLIHTFQPSVSSLREILQLENGIGNKSIEDAACEYISKNNGKLEYWVQKYNGMIKNYEILFFYCNEDPDYENNDYMLGVIAYLIREQLEIPHAFIEVRKYNVSCSNIYYLKDKIEHYMNLNLRQRLLGAVIDGKHITKLAKTVDRPNLPIFLYDAPAVDISTTQSIWLSTGQHLHLALALQRFIFDMQWKRFAILSEDTITAKSFLNEIKKISTNFTFRTYDVKLKSSESKVQELLNVLKTEDNARIILINTNYEDALTILLAAETLKMTDAEGYVWILREWQRTNRTINIRHITISFWCRNNIKSAIDRQKVREVLDQLRENFTNQEWPAKATALFDAAFTIVDGFREVFHKYPETQNDVHSSFTMSQFQNSINGVPIQGTNMKLVYKGRSLEKAMVFLEEWRGTKNMLLERWLVNSTDKSVTPDDPQRNRSEYLKYNVMYWNDGSTKFCFLPSGDKYLPNCHNTELAITLIFVILSPPTLLMIYRLIQNREKKRAHTILLNLIMQRQQNAAIISDHLVDRSALIIRHELGSGRFGNVKLAELKLPGRAPRIVAAKSLREDQDERELVREASILASLVHNHIIRLIGVCIDDKPTLLLMEYAFFGDLLRYLQDRWYLAEGVTSESDIDLERPNEEAVHVSARALTRMAREAASAVAFISLNGVVHRDIRASNFLVDSKRSLKLADFGLARKTTSKGMDGCAEYTSLRRMVLPVRTMAPECLNQGIFSTASDVWALGVLVFELVTLGACPYGDMPLRNVASLICNGGHPPLPYDATPQTTALARLCWQCKPEQRPTAAEVVAYLAERPCALRPAIQCDSNPPGSPDSNDSVTHPLILS